MKKIFRSIVALLCCGAIFASCEQEVAPVELSADLTSIEVEAQNPAEVSVNLSANTSWLLTTPKWVSASATYGSGSTILTFSFETNYKNETTSTLSRQGEIKISGGGALTGKGAVVTIPVTQQGYTYVDPNPSLGGIPDAEEFVDFIKAANSGGPLKRWTAENGDVVLLADINLSNANIDWQALADATDVTNSNNDCAISSTPFTGVFDGDNHKITGFNPTVHLAANQTFGLFSAVKEGVVKNVVLEGNMNVTAEGQADAGMLVGTAFNSTVQNVTVNGKITSAGTTVAKRFSIGGVCGFAYSEDVKTTVIDNATVNADVDFVGGSNTANGATAAMYGGIVGFATTPKAIGDFGVIISNCVNNGDMNVTLGRCSGIVATANSGTTITGCINNGDQINKIANGRLGNIVCNLAYNSHIINCVNNGDLDATADGYKGTVGGIFALAGDATSIIEGGGNYGTIKTLSTAGKYIGLLWANHNNTIPTKNMVASGRIFVDGVEREINASNYMEHIGFMKNPDCVTDIMWIAPKN
jgi:hypothetical protein